MMRVYTGYWILRPWIVSQVADVAVLGINPFKSLGALYSPIIGYLYPMFVHVPIFIKIISNENPEFAPIFCIQIIRYCKNLTLVPTASH